MLSATQALCVGSFLFVLPADLVRNSRRRPRSRRFRFHPDSRARGERRAGGRADSPFRTPDGVCRLRLPGCARCVLAATLATGRSGSLRRGLLLGGNNASSCVPFRGGRIRRTRPSEPRDRGRHERRSSPPGSTRARVRTADLVPAAHYAGSFYAATGLYVLAAVLPCGSRPLCTRPIRTPPARRLGEIAAQPVFRVAVLARSRPMR